MRRGNYITAEPVITTSTSATGNYEILESQFRTSGNRWPKLPSTNWTMESSNGYGVTNTGGVGRNDGVYPNTSFRFKLTLSDIPAYLVGNSYIICIMTSTGAKNDPVINSSGVLGDSNYDFHSNVYDYDVVSSVSLLTDQTTYYSPYFKALWVIGTQKLHYVSFYVSPVNSTDTGYGRPLLTNSSMWRMSFGWTNTFSKTTVEEGTAVSHTLSPTTNGRVSSTATMRLTHNPTGAAVATDISGMFDTSFTVSATTNVSRTYTAVNDGVTESSEGLYFNADMYCPVQNGYSTYTSGSFAFNISDPPPPPSFITAGNKATLYGSVAAYPPSASFTGLQNASVDDASVSVPIGFNFYMAGTAYTAAYVGSNTYITFGAGSSAYSSLGATNPPNPKFMLGAADNSYQRVSYQQSSPAGNWCKIRYEGNGSTSGTVGSPGIVLEITLYNPSFLGTAFYVCEVLIGNHNRSGGVWGAYSASAVYDSGSGYTGNSSYVFVSGDTTGSSWKLWSNYYVNVTT